LTFPAHSPAALLLWFSQGFGNQPGGQGFGGQGFGGQGFGNQPGGSPNPYAGTFGPQQPPPKKSNIWLWLLGGFGLAGVLFCGCCGGFFYFGLSQVNNAMQQEVAGHPDIAKHLGEIQSMSMNVIATGEETDKRGDGVSVLVYDVKGSNGKKGQLLGAQARNPQPGDFFQQIDLKLPSGEVISIK
jgi:hypothetical protein